MYKGYNMALDIWSILIIVFIFQGVFILFSIIASPKKRKKRENIFLLLIILTLLWYLLEFLSVRNVFNVGFNLFYGTRYGSWLLLGPLTYFYYKAITDKEWTFSKKAFIHLLPFIVLVFIIPLFFGDVLNKRQVDYGMLSVFDHREKIIEPIQYMYSVVFILQFVHLGFYLLKNINVIKTYTEELRLEYATINGNIKWLKTFNITLITILLFTAVFLYILLKTDIYRRHLDYIYVLPIGFLFYLIGYYMMNVEWKTVDKKTVKYANSSLAVEHLPMYVKQLEHLIDEEKIYLKNDIRLKDLAAELDVKSHHLSQIINQYYKVSFFDFINKNRVEYAKSDIANTPNKPLIQVAFDSGFNNKTSFINAFKKFENKTPSKYRESIQNS